MCRDAVIWQNSKLAKPNISRGSTSFLSICSYHNTLPSVLCPVLPLHMRGTGCLGAQIQLKEEQSALHQVFEYPVIYTLLDTGCFSQQHHWEAFPLVRVLIALRALVCQAFCDEKVRKKRKVMDRKRQIRAAKKFSLLARRTLISVWENKGVNAKGLKCHTQHWFETQICNSRSETKVWLLLGLSLICQHQKHLCGMESYQPDPLG